ncbi:hypothetical protein J2Z58_001180 [Halobacillus andaensis]|nr:hypothetical protein [Halobacillus andaensis]
MSTLRDTFITGLTGNITLFARPLPILVKVRYTISQNLYRIDGKGFFIC